MFSLTILCFLFWFVVANDDITADYNKLVHYAKLNSFAYCITKGLKPGIVSEGSNCPIARCKDPEFDTVQVLDTFNFNDLGDVGSGFYGIDRQKTEIILAFRGTSSRRDWITNLNTFPIPYSPLINLRENEEMVECQGCLVHKGFYNFLKKNLADVLSVVKQVKLSNPNYKLIVLGHSLGGSFALLSGIEFQLMGYAPEVVTFASPKIGNQELSSFIDSLFVTEKLIEEFKDKPFDKGYIRVTHEGDLVPYLPPTKLFTHAGIEYRITTKELPHEPSDLVKVDHKSPINDIDVDFRWSKLLTGGFTRGEHATYFVKITGCKPRIEEFNS